MKRLILNILAGIGILFIIICAQIGFGNNQIIIYGTDSVVIVPNLKLNGLFSAPNNPHANYGFNDSSAGLEVTQNTWKQVTNAAGNLFITDHEKNITYLTGDTFQIDIAGDYSLTAWVGYQGTTGVTWKFRAAITRSGSTTTEGFTSPRKTSTNDLGSVPFSQDLHDLQAGDKITVEIINTTNSTNPTIVSMNLIFRKVG
jgi:hypothetical protein